MEYSVQFSHCGDWLFVTPLTACSMPQFPVHQLLELVQTHVNKVSDAIQPTHVLLSPSPLAFSLSQHRLHGLQHIRLPCPSTPRACSKSNSCPLSQWCHPTISSSVVVFSSCFQSFQHQGLFQWVSSSYQVVKGLEFQLQHQSFQGIFRIDFL